MWRQVSFNAACFPQVPSPRKVRDDGIEAHSHSPRSRASLARPTLPPPTLGPMIASNMPMFLRTGDPDPFTEPVNYWRKTSSADISMPDYSTSISRASHSRRVTDPMITDRTDRQYQTMQSVGAYESICEALLPSAPDNTPQNNAPDVPDSIPLFKEIAVTVEENYLPNRSSSGDNSGKLFRLSTDGQLKREESQLNSMPVLSSGRIGIRGRKENMLESPCEGEPSGNTEVTRTIAQSFASAERAISSGSKRQRVVTPAAFKVIDEEDEPKSSPTRKVSQAGSVRSVLNGIENNIL